MVNNRIEDGRSRLAYFDKSNWDDFFCLMNRRSDIEMAIGENYETKERLVRYYHNTLALLIKKASVETPA